MKSLTFSVLLLLLLLLSCKCTPKRPSETSNYKLISTFLPAFEEPSEITFVDSDTLKYLGILIKKNRRLNLAGDTFYFKTVALSEKQAQVIHDAVPKRLDSLSLRESTPIVDGIEIIYRYVHNGDTTFAEFQSPVTSTREYELASATLDTYQDIFKDSIVSNYFDELKAYLDHNGYLKRSTMTPLKRMREQKYEGRLRYVH